MMSRIFDGFAWLRWEVNPGTLERPTYDYLRLWQNSMAAVYGASAVPPTDAVLAGRARVFGGRR